MRLKRIWYPIMTDKASHEPLEQRVKKPEKEALERKRTDAAMEEALEALALVSNDGWNLDK